MPTQIHSLVLALAAAVCFGSAFAADVPPVKVQERVLVMPELPAGVEVPMNLPEDGAIKMPFVSGGAPGVARRINEAVWREMLDGASAPTGPGKTFTPPPDKLPEGTISLQYEAEFIPADYPRLLSLGFNGEGCGAYCEEYTQSRTFDLRDGHEILLGDLLTAEGYAAVGRRVDAERRQAYQKQVRELRIALKSAPKGKKADESDDADRLAFNLDCLKKVDTAPATPRWLLEEVVAINGRGELVLSIGRCSNHAMRALDDVGDITVAMAAADLRSSLSPYGLAIMLKEGDAPAPPAVLERRELHGRLGSMPVTMTLEPLRDGANTRGWYAYDKYRTPIQLSVHLEHGDVHAVEQSESQGRFDLSTVGGALSGTWSDKDNRKELPVLLQ